MKYVTFVKRLAVFSMIATAAITIVELFLPTPIEIFLFNGINIIVCLLVANHMDEIEKKFGEKDGP